MPQTAEDVVAQTGRQSAISSPRSHPQWMAWVPNAAILSSIAYGALRLHWALHGPPSFRSLHFDLIYFSGWSAVGLCAAAALIAILLRLAPWRWPLLVAGWAVCAAHLVACPLLLLDIVSAILPGIGASFSPAGFFSRSGCLIQGVLLGAAAIAYRRRLRSDCLFCGRSGSISRPSDPPQWAWLAAYAAVAGCLVRLGAQYFLAFGDLARHVSGPRLITEALIFEAAFLLAGVILPLSLVHRWGRTLPAWVPLLAGRRVPRWLLLTPAFVLSPLMTAYFSITLVKIATDTILGISSQTLGPFRPVFFWVAVPGYLIWGIGLGIAALGYQRITRPRCRACGF